MPGGIVRARPLRTNSRETLTHAGLAPTSRSSPISVNEFNTTDAVAPSGSATSALLASRAAEQQLVTGDVQGPVEDRLSCDEYLCHGCAVGDLPHYD